MVNLVMSFILSWVVWFSLMITINLYEINGFTSAVLQICFMTGWFLLGYSGWTVHRTVMRDNTEEWWVVMVRDIFSGAISFFLSICLILIDRVRPWVERRIKEFRR